MDVIREFRGSVVELRPITPTEVSALSNGQLSYEQLSGLLNRFGLDIGKVVYAPGRELQNTFYTDYDLGLYCTIFLSLKDFEQTYEVLFEQLASKRDSAGNYLKTRDWRNYYFMDVPFPLQAYDFQRRMYDIEPDKVFELWLRVHKRLDYSNGVWKQETLDYIFSLAPPCPKPEPGENGLVTVYRGMGTLSIPAGEAICWSTHPGNALWFANHTGRGTCMLSGEVSPEEIVWYCPGFSNENEVLVRPHTVRNIRDMGMLPANEETFLPLTVPFLPEYLTLGRQARKFGYSESRSPGYGHGIRHILRVLFLSLAYYYHSGDCLSEQDKSVLVYFAILHDVGRAGDGVEESHGDAAVEEIHRRNLRIKGVRLSRKDLRIAELMIRFHCREDAEGFEAIQAVTWLSRKEKKRASVLYRICKDMDGLDRVRFNGLDLRMLRTPYARRLPLIAGCLLKEDVLGILDQDSHEGKEDNDG